MGGAMGMATTMAIPLLGALSPLMAMAKALFRIMLFSVLATTATKPNQLEKCAVVSTCRLTPGG